HHLTVIYDFDGIRFGVSPSQNVGGHMYGFAFEAGRSRGRVHRYALQSSVCAMSVLTLYSLLAADPSAAQAVPDGQKNLPQINVAAARKRAHGRPSKPSAGSAATPTPAAAAPPGATGPTGGTAAASPLNTGTVAASASRLGLTVRQTPATVEVIDQRTMTEQ